MARRSARGGQRHRSTPPPSLHIPRREPQLPEGVEECRFEPVPGQPTGYVFECPTGCSVGIWRASLTDLTIDIRKHERYCRNRVREAA